MCVLLWSVMVWGMWVVFGSMLLFFLVEIFYKGGKIYWGCKWNRGVIV